jgi:uncharacterized protein YqgC (DUF456 family)
MTGFDVLVAFAIVVGVVGVVVPVLPGALLVWGAIVAWGVATGTGSGWTVVATATVVLVVGQFVKYAIPGRQLKASGVPNRSVVIGGLTGIVGFFVIPVIGLIVGFVLGVYVSEYQRVGRRNAWPSTTSALRAVGVSMLIELASVLAAAAVWTTGVVVT